jgi:diguanylate cyclase (GGDEF)-like protein
MPDIPRASAAGGVTWGQKHPGQKNQGQKNQGSGGQRSPYAAAAYGEADHLGHGPDWAIDVQGLNFAALPPEVQQVITTLMGEVEALTSALHVAQGRIGYLEQMVDQHAFMPILNRRAILRELAQLSRQPNQGGVQDQAQPVGAAVLLYLENFETLMRRWGLADAEKALIHLSRQLAGSVRASDRVGSVGGAALLAVMPTALQQGVRHKMDSFLAILAQRPLNLGPKILELEVRSAVVEVFAGDDPEDVLALADDAIRHARHAAGEAP